MRELGISEDNKEATIFTPQHTSDPAEQTRLSEMLEAYIVAYTAHYLEMQATLFFERQTAATRHNVHPETNAVPWTKSAQDMLERLARYVSNDELKTFLDSDKLLSALKKHVPFVFTREDLDTYMNLGAKSYILFGSPRHLIAKTANYLLNRYALDNLQGELYTQVADALTSQGKQVIDKDLLFSIVSTDPRQTAMTDQGKIVSRLVEIAEMRMALTPAHLVDVVQKALLNIDPHRFAAQIAEINVQNINRIFLDRRIAHLCTSSSNLTTCDNNIEKFVRGEIMFHLGGPRSESFARRFNKTIGDAAECPLPDPIIPEQ